MNTTPWPEGIKKTKQREAIWSVLTTADKPMTAIGIAEKLGDSDTTWMSTIYRTLELLETKGIVTRTTLMMLIYFVYALFSFHQLQHQWSYYEAKCYCDSNG